MLVNREHVVPSELPFEIVSVISPYPNRSLEKETYQQFLKLKEFIQEKGYTMEIESGYRSIAYQQKVWDEIENENGHEYTKKHVAVPGYSEHHLGLAVDFSLREGDTFLENEDIISHPAFPLIMRYAYQFGFILRYPKGKEDITGYAYEPWHLRYIQNVEMAKEISSKNLCLEEFLEKKNIV